MSHPTRSASPGKENGHRSESKLRNSQLPRYKAPTIQTYADQSLVKDASPVRRVSNLQPRHV